MRRLAKLCILSAGLLAGGCAGPNPTQTRVSLLCWYSPRVNVYLADGGVTNAPVADVFRRSGGDANTQLVSPAQSGACIILDNQLAFPNGSGTASSNSVLSGITVPLTN